MRRSFFPLFVLCALAAPGAWAQSYAELIDDARLYADPSAYAEVVTTVPEDAVVELLGCVTSWCEVRLGDERGYLRQRNLMATDRRPEPPPVSAPAPPPVAPPPPSAAPLPTPTASVPVVQQHQEATQESTAPAPAAPPPAQGPAASASHEMTQSATDAVPRVPSVKSPVTGTLLSAFLPGAGHVYAGEPGAGATFLLLSASAPAVGYLLSDRTADPTCVPSPADERSACSDTTNFGPLFVGIGIAATAWVAGLIDAGRAVRRSNERAYASNVQLSPVADASRAGLALRVTF
jgi:hypothetical protein